MQPSRYRHSILIACAILFFIFFQLIADFVAAIYAIGLLSLSLTVEVAAALLLLSPLIMVFFRQTPSRKLLAALGVLVMVSGVVEVILNTRGRLYVSGLGTACFLIFLPAFLLSQPENLGNANMGISLAFGAMLTILDRVLRSGVGPSMTRNQLPVTTWILATLGGITLFQALSLSGANRSTVPSDRSVSNHPQTLKIIGLSLGIAASMVLVYFAFSSPVVIARWTGTSYPLILAVLLVSWSVCVTGQAWKPRLFAWIRTTVLLAWNGLFVVCLTLTILAHQVHFPASPAGYPFLPITPPWQAFPLFVMLFLSPVILVDFTLFCQEIIIEKPSIRLLGGSFAIGSLFMLVIIFAQVFTTVYDYIPVVGPFFRNRFWFVFLIDGLVLTLPTLLIRRTLANRSEEPTHQWFFPHMAILMIVVTVYAIFGAFFIKPTLRIPSDTGSIVRLLTYNIQQGYSQDGQINIDGQMALIRQLKPDVVGLQESDMARISGGNADSVRYFAFQLNMYSYYGPSTVVGTFGIALLSRYPILNPRTYYLYSVGEQTAVIYAQIIIGEKTYNVFVTHLGNDGPIIQQEQVLQLVQGKDNVLLMGDFNFIPDTDQYRLTTTTLADAWLLRPSQNELSLGFDPSDRIDYLYLSPDMKVLESEYIPGTESDHPVLITELER